MKEIVEKLEAIRNQIVSEKGSIRLLALIARIDLEDRWDILLSADWLKESNSEEDLVYLIQKLKAEFDGNIEFLARIVLLTTNELFVQQLARSILREGRTTGEFIDLKTSTNFIVSRIFSVAFNFTQDELAETAPVEEGPIASKEAADF